MFKTKRDVDRHVSHILNRIREEKERNSRGYQFAKLYYEVADYESGKRYLQAFLSVRETVPQAHKLMGQIHEAQKDKNKAIESYKRSLDLEPEQKDVILKVCELYSDASVKVNGDVAKVWIERAETFYPNDHTVFKLKEKMVDMDGAGNSEELEHLLSQELLKNPHDAKLHIKLIRLFIQSGEIDRAFQHAISTEKTLAFVSSMDWYECLADVYQVYEDQNGVAEQTALYVHKLSAMATLTFLRLKSDERDVLGAVKALQLFDEDMYAACNFRRHSSEWDSFLREMKGQLFYLMALLLLKRALKGQVSWKEAGPLSTVCFLISDSHQAIDLKSSWYCQVKPDWKKFYDRLYMSGCDRLSQGGHMIYSLLSKQDGSHFSKKLRQKCTPQCKTSLYGLVFTGAELGKKKENSYFLQSDIFTSTSLDIPARSGLLQYDGVAYSLHSGDLNHIVWLALQHYSLKDDVQPDYEQLFGYQLFHDMKYSMSDLSGGDPGTMCQLDVQVFVYSCIRWASLQLRDQKRTLHAISDKPNIMPACLSPPSCNKQQCQWWTAVDNMERKSSSEKLSKLWGVIMRGLETIRLVIPNSMSLPFVVHVARTLDARAHEIASLDAEGIVTPKLSGMMTRAAFYWTTASEMLDRMDRNSGIRMPKEMLFPSDNVIDPAVIKEIREQVKFAMATIAMKREDFREALSAFENLYKPEASYYTGQIYRKMAESQDVNDNSTSGANQNSHHIALLTKSKMALYQALDRLDTEHNEELKDAVRRDLDDVVCKLISLESGGGLADSILSSASQNYDTAESDIESDDEPVKHHTPRTPVLPLPSQIRETPRPSPTRLEIQLRALETSNTAVSSRLSTLEETVRNSSNLIQEILIQLRQSRDENKTLRDQLQILSLQGLSSMSMVRAPGTPQQPPGRMNPVNMSFGGAPVYDMPGQNGVPLHMAQYGYPAASPRPGSAYGHVPYDDGFSHVDGEFYDPDHESEFYNTDQNLVQEWPFGHKAGVEGKSTITYSPQQQQQQPPVRGMNPANAGMYANALRGPSVQYGGAGYPAMVPPQQPPAQLPLPGPGYFSQNSPQIPPCPVQSQMGMVPGQFGMAPKPGVIPAMQPRPGPVQSSTSKPTTPMMPPNAVIANQCSESKPTLIPGSVGIPAASSKPSTSSAASATTQGQGQTSEGSASSILSSFAANHQEGSSPANISTPQKTVFKGFSFTSTPKIAETKADDKSNGESPLTATPASTPKPFSGFSLTPSKPTAASTRSPFMGAAQSTAAVQGTSSVFMHGQNLSPSFGSLAAQGQTTDAFQATVDQRGFAGVGLPIFGKTPPRRHNISTGSDDHIDEYEPNVDFKPVIKLPELIEVKTGEEEEEKMFCERAKLFRFDKDANQWKERGIGDIKILRHRETMNVRILMRREQVLKLCANHKITTEMKLTQMSSSDRAWVWNAMDFAEGEMKLEKLAVRFKSVDIADKFKTAFEKCQVGLSSVENEPTKKTEKIKSKDGDSKTKTDKHDLASIFKQKAGSWTCDGCYVNNDGEVLKCLCCGSLKPGVKEEDIKKEPATPVFGGKGFTFGTQPSEQSQSTGGFQFGTPRPSEQSQATGGFKFFMPDPNTMPKTESGFTFESGPPPTDSKPSNSSGFKFGSTATSAASQPASGFSLGSLPASSTQSTSIPAISAVTTESKSSGGFVFGGTSVAETTTSHIFGQKPDTAPCVTEGKADTTSGNNFGGKPDTNSGSIFGGKPDTTSSGIFGGKPDTTSGSIFGGKIYTTAAGKADTTSGSIFGGKPDTTNGNNFGGNPDTNSGSIFGGKPDITSSGIFGQKPDNTSGSSFGGKANTTSGSVFGQKPDTTSGSSFGVKANTTSGSIFGQKPDTTSGSSFGGKPSASKDLGSLFGELATVTPDSSTQDATEVSADTKQDRKKKPVGIGESLLARFLSSPNSWYCNVCHVGNEGINEKCLSCSTTRSAATDPISTAPSLPEHVTTKPASEFKFGSSQDSKDKDSKAGFTFGLQTDKIGTDKATEGFNFESATDTASAEGFKFTFPPTSEDEKPQPAASLGSGFNFSLTMTPLSKKKSASPRIAGITSPKSPEISEEGFYVNKEGDDSHIYFEPVIELPDHVEVKTGEEDEELIFSHRSKLFRFIKGEWKERGIGDVKVLYQEDANKARIVMRREQILKLCCNHYIFPELTFMPMPKSNGCALVWYAMDFAEGEPKSEQFSIKFKSEDVAKKFENAVDEAKGRMSGDKVKPKEKLQKSDIELVPDTTIGDTNIAASSVTEEDDVVCTSVEEATGEEIQMARELMLPDHFYLYTRKPPCPGCRGCYDGLPGFEHSSGDIDQNERPEDLSQSQEDYEDDDDNDYEDDDDDDDDDYGDEEETYEDEAEGTAETGSFMFGDVYNQVTFASVAAGSSANSFNVDSNKPFHWQGAGRQLFGGADDTGVGGDEGDVQQGEEQHFEPVVPLPELIDVKTGEEDETVEFSKRAKLYRFDKDANQWKEKGIGEMKILKHEETGKYRLLLRREQVHKLACNHLLTADLNMTPMNTSETAWCWTAQDFSGGEPRVEQLAVKFKTIDLAKSFKQKVDGIQKQLQDDH